MYTALRATSLSLVAILQDKFNNDQSLRNFFNPADGGNMIISLNTPEEMTENQTQGISVWLYRIVRDGQRLNAPPIRVASDQLGRVPLPFCLYYLMTPIINSSNASSPETEQLILGKVLQTFHDFPLLRGNNLEGEFAGTSVELRVRFAPISLEEISRVWDSLERSYQLSVSYEVSVVYIESDHQPSDIHPVEVSLPEYGVIVASEEN